MSSSDLSLVFADYSQLLDWLHFCQLLRYKNLQTTLTPSHVRKITHKQRTSKIKIKQTIKIPSRKEDIQMKPSTSFPLFVTYLWACLNMSYEAEWWGLTVDDCLSALSHYWTRRRPNHSLSHNCGCSCSQHPAPFLRTIMPIASPLQSNGGVQKLAFH